MSITRKQIKQMVFDELESGTDALVEDEIEDLSTKIADRLVTKLDDAYDGDDDISVREDEAPLSFDVES